MRAELTVVGKTAKYSERVSPCLEGLSNGGEVRYILSSSNNFWHSSVQVKAFLNVLKNGRDLSMARETKQLRATTLPVRLYTSFTVFGGAISNMAFILSGLASIPLWDTMNPKNFPDETPKAHLPGLSFMQYWRSVLKVSFKSSK